jgi:hypothetical protein
LCHYTFDDVPDLWLKLKSEFRDIIIYGAYCSDLIARLTGVDEKTAVVFYNQNIADF